MTPNPEHLHEIETALLCAAVRCAWGAADKADLKILAIAVKAAGDHLCGTPAYGLAMVAAGFLAGEPTWREQELGRAVQKYCHERMPPGDDEAADDTVDPPEPPGVARNWARDHDLMG